MAEQDVLAGLDDFGRQAYDRLVSIIGERNEKVGLLAAASGDSQALLEALRDTSDDPKVVEINAKIEKLKDGLLKLETERDAALAPVVEAMQANSAEKVEGITAEVDHLDKSIRVATSYIKDTFGDEVIKTLPALKSRRGRASDGTAGGTRRVKGFDVYVDGKLATLRDAKGVDRSNLAAAAKVIGCQTTDIQSGFFEAQGTQDSDKYKDTVEFTITSGDKSFVVKCVRAEAASTAAVKAGVED